MFETTSAYSSNIVSPSFSLVNSGHFDPSTWSYNRELSRLQFIIIVPASLFETIYLTTQIPDSCTSQQSDRIWKIFGEFPTDQYAWTVNPPLALNISFGKSTEIVMRPRFKSHNRRKHKHDQCRISYKFLIVINLVLGQTDTSVPYIPPCRAAHYRQRWHLR